MNNMLSIAMGAYNCGNTLSQTLDSLINQTFKDFTCYICDDGSTDNTRAVIEEYAKKDNRFVLLINEKNMGLSHSLNKCIAAADSKYIARMDGDDIALPNRFEKQIEFLEAHPEIDFCGSAIRYFDSNGEWGTNIYPETPENKDFLLVGTSNSSTLSSILSELSAFPSSEFAINAAISGSNSSFINTPIV